MTLLLVSIILQGCVQSLDRLADIPNAGIVVEIDQLDPHEVAQSLVGDLSYTITSFPIGRVVGMTSMELRVFDSFGSFAEIIVPIEVVNTTAPTIELIGATVLRVNFGDTWEDPGIRMRDSIQGVRTLNDAALRDQGFVSGVVITSRLGEYLLEYETLDDTGNRSNVLRRRVFVEDLEPPTIVLATLSRLVAGVPVPTQVLQVYDNVDKLTINDVVVSWGAMNPLNPKVGRYEVVFRLGDLSGNITSSTRIFTVIYSTEELLNRIDELMRLQNTREVFRLIEEYKQYPEINQNRLFSKEQDIIVNQQRIFVDNYYVQKDNFTPQQAINYLITNRGLFPEGAFETELHHFVSREVLGLQQDRDYVAAIRFIARFDGLLNETQYRNLIRQQLSLMASATSRTNAQTHRSILNQYAGVIGGMNNINYITYSKAITDGLFMDYWDAQDYLAATTSMRGERNRGYVSVADADRTVARAMLLVINRNIDDGASQQVILTWANSISYDFTTIRSNWYVQIIEDAFRS